MYLGRMYVAGLKSTSTVGGSRSNYSILFH